MQTVYCIGELLIDFMAEKQGNDLSKAKEFSKKAGGAPANVACAIAKLGGRSTFIGSVGNDPFGTFLLGVLSKHGVDISLAQRCKAFTSLAFVSLAEDGERDFVFSRGADKKLKYDPKIKIGFKGNVLHFGAATAMLGGNLEEAYHRYFFDALTQQSFISFDPNFRSDLWRDEEEVFIKKSIPFIEKSHLCKFSLEEAHLLSKKTDLYECCDFFHGLGAPIITITLGGEGTLLSTATSKKTIPSISVKPVDTTGAGDSFMGCLLYQIALLNNPHEILESHDLLAAMVKKANKAGAVTITGHGAIPSLPTYDEVFTQ